MSPTTRRRIVLAMCVSLAAAACSSGDGAIPLGSRTPQAETTAPSSPSSIPSAGGTRVPADADAEADADVVVEVDTAARGTSINPLILGFSSGLTAAELDAAGTTLNSWGGNPSTRFNYEIGHAWNHGADWEFRNTNYGSTGGDDMRGWLDVSAEAGVQSRVAIPTLGWIARNDDQSLCSFPNGDGGCLPASEVGDCNGDGPVADPNRANVPSTPEMVREWLTGLVADGYALDIVAMDNEPDLWGFTHYDVHPECPTYEEVLDRYLTYAQLVREVSPDSKLAGPVMCCWYDYWDIAPGPADGSDEEFLPWFLRQVKAHDDQSGQRTLDYVDVHYYPQSNVFNSNTDAETNARRVRSTRSLWDPTYADESWIRSVIYFIPRIREVIEANYPGTPMLISEWNFGADASMNGAVTIAEVLGVFGREGVEAAAYWRNPEPGTPGWFAFKMYGNYDDAGSRFGGATVPATSSDEDRLSAFAAVDDASGVLRLMIVNKDPADALTVAVGGVDSTAGIRRFSYGATAPDGIVQGAADLAAPIDVPAESIMLLEVPLT